MGPSRPAVRVFKSKFKYVQEMNQIAQAPGRPPFSDWKEYKRCLEELEECKYQVSQFRQQNLDYKNSIQHILENCDHEVREASKALDRSKHFFKWSKQVRRHCKSLYVRNLVLNAQLRSMKQDLEEARRLLKRYEGTVVIPPLRKMAKFDHKSMTKATPTLSPLLSNMTSLL